ncbi:hypothetical protein ACB092_03G108100 [Castanea dentata]
MVRVREKESQCHCALIWRNLIASHRLKAAMDDKDQSFGPGGLLRQIIVTEASGPRYRSTRLNLPWGLRVGILLGSTWV